MNDTHTIESALPMLEFAPKEVKLGAAGVVGVALIAYYLNNKIGVNSFYSEFTQLVAAMKVEREDFDNGNLE